MSVCAHVSLNIYIGVLPRPLSMAARLESRTVCNCHPAIEHARLYLMNGVFASYMGYAKVTISCGRYCRWSRRYHTLALRKSPTSIRFYFALPFLFCSFLRFILVIWISGFYSSSIILFCNGYIYIIFHPSFPSIYLLCNSDFFVPVTGVAIILNFEVVHR
jgi:hypothetical protein